MMGAQIHHIHSERYSYANGKAHYYEPSRGRDCTACRPPRRADAAETALLRGAGAALLGFTLAIVYVVAMVLP